MNAESCVDVGNYRCGPGQPLLVIAGPCVIESEKLCQDIAQVLVEISQSLPVNIVFKASFDKANRTSASSSRGPGLQDGLEILGSVKAASGLPVTTDIHLPEQAGVAAEVCDLLQIPAFLCRQTTCWWLQRLQDSHECQRTIHGGGRYAACVGKTCCGWLHNALLCERGTFFGYGRLVNDFSGLLTMRSFGAPVIFDATHSVQRPASHGDATGGDRTLVEPLARAAAAVGVDGVFFETHPEPDTSPSDGSNMVPLSQFRSVLERVLQIHAVRVSMEEKISVMESGREQNTGSR